MVLRVVPATPSSAATASTASPERRRLAVTWALLYTASRAWAVAASEVNRKRSTSTFEASPRVILRYCSRTAASVTAKLASDCVVL